MVTLVQKPSFAKTVKKLHANQKNDLYQAIKTIMTDPACGEMKVQDLAGVRCYKFKMVKQLTLLAYQYDEMQECITLLTLGSHENFYRDLKKKLQ